MINVHAHVWDQRLHMADFTVREAALSRGRAIDLTVDVDRLLEDNRAMDHVVVFGLKGRLCGYWVPDEYVADAVARGGGKLIGFAACDPTQEGYMEELRTAIEELGLRGVKMGPAYGGFDPGDARCDEIYAYCQERRLPILFHAGTTYNRLAVLKYAHSELWDDVAVRFPELRVVLAHLGHPFSDECICVIRKHPHVYADISALYYRPWQFYNMLVTASEYGVTHKLLFGTDYPFTTVADSITGLRNINAVAGGSGGPRVTDEVIEGILNRDSLALLGVE